MAQIVLTRLIVLSINSLKFINNWYKKRHHDQMLAMTNKMTKAHIFKKQKIQNYERMATKRNSEYRAYCQASYLAQSYVTDKR